MRDYHELVETVELTDDDVSATVHKTCADDLYFRVKEIHLCVYEASTGDGILEILDSEGGFVWKTYVDVKKDLSIPFGKKGVKVGQNTGIQAVLSGAITQASVSLCVIAHLSID